MEIFGETFRDNYFIPKNIINFKIAYYWTILDFFLFVDFETSLKLVVSSKIFDKMEKGVKMMISRKSTSM